MSRQRLIFRFKKEYRPAYLAIPVIDFGKECLCCNKKTSSTHGFQTYGGSGSTYTPEPIKVPLCNDCTDHVHPDHISFFIPFSLVMCNFLTLIFMGFGIADFSLFSIIFGPLFLSASAILYWYFYRRPVSNAKGGHFPLTRFIVYRDTFGVVSRNELLIERLKNNNRRIDLDMTIKNASWWH